MASGARLSARAVARAATLAALALLLAAAFLAAPQWREAFASAPGVGTGSRLAARGAVRGAAAAPGARPIGGSLAVAFSAAAAAVTAAAAVVRGRRAGGKTSMRYTTETILPALTWLKVGFKDSDLANGQLEAACLAGVDVVIGKTSSGKLFAVGDKCPPIGSSLCVGGDVEGDLIVDSQYGSAFNVFTGYPESWCPSPPILGGLIGSFMGGPQELATFECRASYFGGDVEVLVDINAKKSYEAAYWKGLLDAQGKVDGTYY